MEQDFTNREIEAMFKGITDVLQAHGKTHEEILGGVKYTNGKLADVQAWRERVNGAFIASAVFMSAVVIPMFGWAIYTMLHIDEMISDGIKDALTVYDINND